MVVLLVVVLVVVVFVVVLFAGHFHPFVVAPGGHQKQGWSRHCARGWVSIFRKCTHKHTQTRILTRANVGLSTFVAWRIVVGVDICPP